MTWLICLQVLSLVMCVCLNSNPQFWMDGDGGLIQNKDCDGRSICVDSNLLVFLGIA